MSNQAAISAQGLALKIGKTTLLQPLNLAFFQGEFIGVLGPSGCGKSTLLRCLAGLQKPSAGQVSFSGKPLAACSPEELRKIGFVPQDDVVHGSLKVDRALTFTGRLLGLEGADLKTQVDKVVQLLELGERLKVRTDRLSGGQRKRVSIAVELMAEPTVLFLDEPTAGLDPALEDSFMSSCKGLCQGGRTLIMSTHVMQSVDLLDLVVVLHKGHLLYFGPPGQLPGYFGVPSLIQVYKHLETQDPAQAMQRFAQSSFHATYVAGRSV